MSSAPDPSDTDSRFPVEPVPHRIPGGQRKSPVHFNFDDQPGYTGVKGVYYMMIRNLQLSCGSQDIQ